MAQRISSTQLSFSTTRNVKPNYSRSRNLEYESISKLDDVTKYNSPAHQVAFYKNYPNRSGTPIKINRPQAGKRANDKTRPGISGRNDINDSQMTKNALTTGNAGPCLNIHGSTTNSFVINDFHNKQTNPGFARNNLGGFYTR